MIVQQVKDEFLQLRYDDEQFAEMYDDTFEDFQEWLTNHYIGEGEE